MKLYSELATKKEILCRKNSFYGYIRDFFYSRGFCEAETPVLAEWYGQDINIKPFITRYEDGRTLYLQISPEFFLKKMVIAGYNKVFELSKVFRNGEYGELHYPEFRMLEWYEEGADYMDIICRVEELIYFLSEKFGLRDIDWLSNSEKKSVRDVFYYYTGIDIDEFKDDSNAFLERAREKGYNIGADCRWEETFFILFLNYVEPKLPKDRMLFLYDYPYLLGGMARFKDDFYTERFELYIRGIEIANGYSELTDPDEQMKRWKRVEEAIDIDFIEGLRLYNGKMGGVAVGIDRLFMLFMNKGCLRDVVLFPFEYVRRRDA